MANGNCRSKPHSSWFRGQIASLVISGHLCVCWAYELFPHLHNLVCLVFPTLSFQPYPFAPILIISLESSYLTFWSIWRGRSIVFKKLVHTGYNWYAENIDYHLVSGIQFVLPASGKKIFQSSYPSVKPNLIELTMNVLFRLGRHICMYKCDKKQ